mmetsp:Transcript_24703/g.23727  ORF Transcript_24703/g.23727 Transcript_24703/m.23727 type:complete len:242 (-) Transcript_24703:105-830(-)
MHLSACLKSTVFQEDNGHFGNVPTCVTNWIFKRTTEFYESEDLALPWWFGFFCFSYTFRGLVDIYVAPKWPKKIGFPFLASALVLACLQGPISFLADYMNMTNESNIHVIDRCLALPNFALETIKVLCSFHFVRKETFLISVMCLPCACYAFLQSSDAQNQLDADSFIFWHNMWHMIPLITIPLHLYEYIIRGELNHSEHKEYYDSRPPLLSSVVMSKAIDKSASESKSTAQKIKRRTRKE